MESQVSSKRWIAVLAVGIAAWYLAEMLAAVPFVLVTGSAENMVGLELGIYGALRMVLVFGGIALALRIGKARLADIGFIRNVKADEILAGLGAGLGWGLLQLFVLIPLTGGAERSDVIASRALIGNGTINLLGVILLAWSMAGFGEELFYRGFLIHSIEQVMRRPLPGKILGVIVSLLWFAAGHAYQGWVGVLDVGISALLFTFLYLWRGRLIAPILAHAVYDTALFIGLYFLF